MPLSPKESPALLETTLQCLERQTLKANELVIAVDGPLKKDLETIIQSSKLPIKLYTQEKPLGIGATLKKIAPSCIGDLIVRIDSDDLYSPEHTELITKPFTFQSKLGVVGCQLLEVDIRNNSVIASRQTPISPRRTNLWLSWRNPMNHQTVAINKQALLQAGGYRHMPNFEDWDLWLRISKEGYELINLPLCTVAARVNRNHRKRRLGIKYLTTEINFYQRQITEKKISLLIAFIACLSRLPWRLLPVPILNIWMQSKLRGSPTMQTSWVTQSILDHSR